MINRTVNRTTLVNAIALSLAVETNRIAHFHFQQQDCIDFAIEIDNRIKQLGFNSAVNFDKELEVTVKGNHDELMPEIKQAICSVTPVIVIHFMFSHLAHPQSSEGVVSHHYEARQLYGRGSKVMIVFTEKN